MVEFREEAFLCMDQTHSIVKGKRTKRQRTPSLLNLSMACSSSSNVLEDNNTSGDEELTTRDSGLEEEEGMANCLMLLAQGHRTKQQSSSEPTTTSRGKVIGGGMESFQCKTCNRCFPSFQALGGHRASHRKPKVVNGEDKKVVVSGEGNRVDQIVNPNTTLSLQIPIRVLHGAGKPKLHECAICGAEFTSGQALGGHMRRHRTVVSASPVTMVGAGNTPSIYLESPEAKKPKNDLRLDLNLPAPEDRESSVQSVSERKQQVIVFSASPLIDCYY